MGDYCSFGQSEIAGSCAPFSVYMVLLYFRYGHGAFVASFGWVPFIALLVWPYDITKNGLTLLYVLGAILGVLLVAPHTCG
jgi:hypothetical protein